MVLDPRMMLFQSKKVIRQIGRVGDPSPSQPDLPAQLKNVAEVIAEARSPTFQFCQLPAFTMAVQIGTWPLARAPVYKAGMEASGKTGQVDTQPLQSGDKD